MNLKAALLITFCWLNFGAYAQTDPKPTSPLFENEDITVTSSILDCVNDANGTAKQYHAVAVINRSDNRYRVSFDLEKWYDGQCATCESHTDENRVQLTLDANSALVGTCIDHSSLLVFKKMLRLEDVRQLTHFELKNIEIETIP